MSKLSGDGYLNYWRARIAMGPDQVGFAGTSSLEVDEQADLFHNYIAMAGRFSELKPSAILEYGSGYGRMLKRLRKIFPDAFLFGVDVCREAVDKSWEDRMTKLTVGHTVPDYIIKFPLIITCTVLQHITDENIFRQVAAGLSEASAAGGTLVLLENVSSPGADHVRDSDVKGYQIAFPDFTWHSEFTFKYRGQDHAVMAGVKREKRL